MFFRNKPRKAGQETRHCWLTSHRRDAKIGHVQAKECDPAVTTAFDDSAAADAVLSLARATSPQQRAVALAAAAKALQHAGRFEEAAALEERAVIADPDNAVIAWHAGLERCRLGDWVGGLAQFDDNRYRDPAQFENNVLRPFTFPHWQGADIRSAHVLGWAEQGVGDQVMQARIIPELAARSGNLEIECNRRLIPLFERSFTGTGFVPQTTKSHNSLGARPYNFQTSLLSAWRFSAGQPWGVAPAYLRAEKARTTAFRDAWGADGHGPNIGLSWRSVAPGHGAMRSLPLALTRAWRAAAPTAKFHSVQYDATPEELAKEAADSELPLRYDADGDAKDDLDRLAARLSALDLLITIDNSTAHLAGALGVATWLILPLRCDWRWGCATRYFPQYQSVRIFHNQQAARWGGLIYDVTVALKEWHKTQASGSRPHPLL